MIKILLVVNKETTALQYHRQLIPHEYLGSNNPEDFQTTMIYNIDNMPDEKLKDFQIVSFLRQVNIQGRTTEIIKRCQDLGCKVIVDIDDNWKLDKVHPQYTSYTTYNIPKQTEEGLKAANWVTTTTPYFADKIKEFNKNVTVLTNAIDPDQPQFQPYPVESERMRFGWVGGVYHSQDIALMQDSVKKLWSDKSIWGKWQLNLAGFNKNHQYVELERMFTNDYKLLSYEKPYVEYLKCYSNVSTHIMTDRPYRRLWGTDVYNYGYLYNEMDVALVPLNDTPFNRCKSQLKIIEAGFMKKAVIASEVHPYTIDLVNNHNALTIKPHRNNIDWFVNMRKLTMNQNMVKDLALQLHEEVVVKYHIKVPNEVRRDLYKQLVR